MASQQQTTIQQVGRGLSGATRRDFAAENETAQTALASVDRGVINKSASFTLSEAYTGQHIIVDCSAGVVTITLPDSIEGAGIHAWITVTGTEHYVLLSPQTGGNLKRLQSGFTPAYSGLVSNGETVRLFLDGTVWQAAYQGVYAGYSQILPTTTGSEVGDLFPGAINSIDATAGGFDLNLEAFTTRTEARVWRFVAALGASGSVDLNVASGSNFMTVTQEGVTVFPGTTHTIDRTKFGSTVMFELHKAGFVWYLYTWNLPDSAASGGSSPTVLTFRTNVGSGVDMHNVSTVGPTDTPFNTTPVDADASGALTLGATSVTVNESGIVDLSYAIRLRSNVSQRPVMLFETIRTRSATPVSYGLCGHTYIRRNNNANLTTANFAISFPVEDGDIITIPYRGDNSTNNMFVECLDNLSMISVKFTPTS